jgi:hypothetical protein
MVPDNEHYYTYDLTKETVDGKGTEKETYDICRLCYIDFQEWMKKIDNHK